MNYIYQTFKKVIVLCGMLTCLMLSTPAFSDDISSGVFGFQQKLANSGNPQAQYKLGTMYESGRGVASDPVVALEWYQKSATQNYQPAADRITYLEIKNHGFKKDQHDDWLNTLKQNAASGDGEAIMLLATSYKNGVGVTQDLNQAQKLFVQAAHKNISGAEPELASTTTLIETKQKKLAQENKRVENEKRRKQAADKQAIANNKLQAQKAHAIKQKAVIEEQKRVKLERDKLEAQQRQAQLQQQKLQQQKQLAKQQALVKQQKQQAAAEAKKAESKGFQKEECKGAKARYLTVCN